MASPDLLNQSVFLVLDDFRVDDGRVSIIALTGGARIKMSEDIWNQEEVSQGDGCLPAKVLSSSTVPMHDMVYGEVVQAGKLGKRKMRDKD